MRSNGGRPIILNVNGQRRHVAPGASRTLLDVLRDDLDLTGAKKACDNGECGSCIVLMGRKPAKACLLAPGRAVGRDVTTIEGLAPRSSDIAPEAPESPALHPLQQAFLEAGATQCGFCIPGMIMKAEALLIANNNPSRADVIRSLSKNLCRCTGYVKIVDAVLHASRLMRSNAAPERPRTATGRTVGVSVPRLDSPATVDGRAKYAADLKMDGMLHARILRSTVHHARILSIDTSEAETMPGVAAVVTAADVPGTPFLPNCQPQVYVFPHDKVRFLGEGLAAVAAASEEAAEAALAKIKVELEPLPAVVELDEAAAEDAPRVFDHTGNVSAPERIVKGDVDKAFAEADVIVERTYTVPVREHAAMEPEAALACEEGGKVVIRTPLYHAFVQGTKSIANNLAIDEDDVRIICPHMGGNFGTRGDTLHAVVAALLARRTGKPVKLVFTRAESLLGSCKAPSVATRYKTGATRDGRVTAVDIEILHGTGSWAPFLVPSTTRGAELCFYETLGALLSHATGPYQIENVRASARDVLTNAPRFVPLRGTNANYLPLAYESQMDLVAEATGIDPLDLRLRNAMPEGGVTHFGQVLNESVNVKAELEALRPHYEEARRRLRQRAMPDGTPWKHGIGVACGWRNIGYVNTTVTAGAELLEDGRIEVLAGSVEQGQGPTTQFAQIAGDELGVPIGSLVVSIGDTCHAPYPVPTFSSITTVATGKAVQDAAARLKAAIVRAAARLLDRDEADLSMTDGGVVVANGSTATLPLREVAAFMKAEGLRTRSEGRIEWNGEAPTILYGYSAGLIELAVNDRTGEVRLLNHVNVCDPGTLINPLAVEGQVDGAVAFGIGFALKERFHPDSAPTLEGYGLPTTRDMPRSITRLFVERPLERGPFGAKSMAEHPGISLTPGIVNAIADATGARVYDVPATPAKVLAAMEGKHEPQVPV